APKTMAEVSGCFSLIGNPDSGFRPQNCASLIHKIITFIKILISEYASLIKMVLFDSDDLKLSKHFAKAIKRLPKKYQDNPAKYDKFISKFGTHYFSSASFGGHI